MNTPIFALTPDRLTTWLTQQNSRVQTWVQNTRFKAKSAELCVISSATGEPESVLLGVSDSDDFWAFGSLPAKLPASTFFIDNSDHFFNPAQYERAYLAWGLGSYQFDTYTKKEPYGNTLTADAASCDTVYLDHLLTSMCMVRNLINTPVNAMNTEHLADVVHDLARQTKAKITVTKGRKLQAEFPAIYAVGKGAECEPQLLDLQWGHPKHPKVTLVGKGIVFDSGGLDLKPASGMRLMKKDLSGAAHAIALARLIMLQKLPIRLRLLVPTAENAIGSKSYHPGDVIKTHAGHTVEIENTDAEGRLVLCDALALAVEEKPDYLIDFATLTGAVAVALGPEIPALYSNNDIFAQKMLEASHQTLDPMWRMPLHKPYQDFFKSDIADLLNASTVPMAGSITAALFLQKFVSDDIPWIHFDFFAYNRDNKPGRPIGGEAMAIRAVFQFLKNTFGTLKMMT